MSQSFFSVIISSLLLFSALFPSLYGEDRLMLISVAPYLEVAKKLGGSDIEVQVIVPAGASSHTYEPTPKQILQATKAQIFFRIGEPFEERAARAILYQNPNLVIVDLRDDLDLIFESYLSEEPDKQHYHGHDPHIWTSPRMMQQQVEYMAEALQAIYPELKEKIAFNAKTLLQDLVDLDLKIAQILQGKEGSYVFVSHPAYGYFCRDYNLNQVAIEFEGKEPTQKQMNILVKEARMLGISRIFTQPQYGFKGPDLIARQIGAKLITLDPYSPDYFASMTHIAREFAEAATPATKNHE
jgi:zinc transport system substrate-binding protein